MEEATTSTKLLIEAASARTPAECVASWARYFEHFVDQSANIIESSDQARRAIGELNSWMKPDEVKPLVDTGKVEEFFVKARAYRDELEKIKGPGYQIIGNNLEKMEKMAVAKVGKN